MDKNLSTLTKVGNWIATLLLGNTRELLIRIDERLGNFIIEMTDFKAETKTEFKEIKSILNGQGERLAVHTTMFSSHTEAIGELKTYTTYQVRNSPTAPSEEGKELLKDSGFDEIYPIIRQKIFKRMESMRLRTLYDYEKEAEFAISAFRNEPIMDRVKDYVVNHEDQSLTLIFQIASWVVRDDYLKEHPLPPHPPQNLA